MADYELMIVKKQAGLGQKILYDLFGKTGAKCFSYVDNDEEERKMQAESPIDNFQIINDKIQECAVANEQLGGLFASIGHGWMESAKTRASLESGQFPENSPDWLNCQQYANEVNQWLQHNMDQMNLADHGAIQAFEELKYVIEQQINRVLAELIQWKSNQRLAILGDFGRADAIVPNLNLLGQSFDKTEKALESFSLLLSQYSINIRDMANWCNLCPTALKLHKERTNYCIQMQKFIQQKCQYLVQKSFVVYEQPPSIVRRSAAPDISKTQKNSKVPFDLELRVLAGETFGLRGAGVEVEVLLITEKQAQEIAKKSSDPLQEKLSTPGLLLAPKVILQAPNNQSDGQMSAVFRGVRVQSMNKRGDEDSDDMYHVLFRTKPFQTNQTDKSQARFWVVSLPFAVLSNAHRQDKYTRARMFWQMSFKVHDETSLATFAHGGKDGNEIRWRDFFPALDLWFRNTTHCREGLNGHWQFIADKLMIAGNNPESLVTWDAFYKKKIGEVQLSFWDWFCPIADHISKMPAYWDSGLILGFASRSTAEHLLKQATLPSMLIRFSESNPGKIVVSYVIPSWNNQQDSIIEHVIFDEKENKALEGKTLAECIRLSQDLQAVQYILPSNKPVTELFALDTLTAQQPEPNQRKSSGYVKPRVALVWRRDPPVPPDCLLNNSMDSSGYEPHNSVRSSNSECLSDLEFEAAGVSLENYIFNEEMAPGTSYQNSVSPPSATGVWRVNIGAAK